MTAVIVINGQTVTGPDHFDHLVKEGLKKWHETPRKPAYPSEPVIHYEPDLIIACPRGLPWVNEPSK